MGTGLENQRGHKGQKGSILVGVLGISVILSMGAAAYVMSGSDAASSRQNFMDRTLLYTSAESALGMAMDYLKTYDATYILGLPTNGGDEIVGWRAMDGALIKTDFHKPATGPVQVRAYACLGDSSRTIRIAVGVHVAPNTLDPARLVIDSLEGWSDTLLSLP